VAGPHAKPAYFPHVDGLRAIAVLSVVIYHLNAAWLPGGLSGVDIFFVISGFIVSASVSSLDRVSLLKFIPFFYARRLQRIGPALIVCGSVRSTRPLRSRHWPVLVLFRWTTGIGAPRYQFAVLEAPKPIFRSPTYRCAEPYNRTNPICSDGTEVDRHELERLRKPALEALTHLASVVPDVRVRDPFPILCPPAPRCSAFSNGRALFFDADHISGYGNSVLLPSLLAFVRVNQFTAPAAHDAEHDAVARPQ
jgi:SGNH domain (fused to AT3 domains)